MIPQNISATLLLGENWNYILFKTAISLAETGCRVWLISPESFNKVPKNIEPPDKEILQLITFMYLKDHKELIKHLNGIHLWHNIPNIILVNNFEIYTNLYFESYNSILAALVAVTLLDSAATCADKKNKTVSLIVTCKKSYDYVNRFKVIKDMYFPNVLTKNKFDKNVLIATLVESCMK